MPIRPLWGEGKVRARDPHSEVLNRATWLDSNITLDHRRWGCGEAELRWTAPRHVIVLTEQGRTTRTHVRAEGSGVYDGEDRPGALTFVPAGAERWGAYREADLIYCALWIDPTLQIPGCERLSQLPTMVNGSDTVIATLLSSLCAEVAAGYRPDSAYIEHLVALAAMRMVSFDIKPKPVSRHAPLNRRQLERVNEFIEAHMDADISLTDLAALANMPVDTFARRFKAATGRAPYAHVIERRIARAETLLATTDTPIGHLALALGFSSQSHFTSAFRRLKGMTPKAYRSQFFPES